MLTRFCSWPIENLASGQSKKPCKLCLYWYLMQEPVYQSVQRAGNGEICSLQQTERDLGICFEARGWGSRKNNRIRLRTMIDRQPGEDHTVLHLIENNNTFKWTKRANLTFRWCEGRRPQNRLYALKPKPHLPPPPIFHNLTFHQRKQVHTSPPPSPLSIICTQAGRVNRILKTLRLSKQKMCSGLRAALVWREAGVLLHGRPSWEPRWTELRPIDHHEELKTQELIIFWHLRRSLKTLQTPSILHIFSSYL